MAGAIGVRRDWELIELTRRVRRVAGAIAVFEDAEMVLLAPTTGKRMPAGGSTLGILQTCSSWTPIDEIRDVGAVEYLIRIGLLVEEGTAAAERDASVRRWQPWGDETISYHFRARRQFLDHPVTHREANALASIEGRPPSPYKTYAESDRTGLPLPASFDVGFEQTLLRRRTCREFAPEPIPLSVFGTLLGLVFGAVERLDAAPFGEVVIRTSPSAGSRHPVEAYVCAVNVEELPPGVYHYAILDHELERLDLDTPPERLMSYMSDWWVADAPFVCFLTGLVERSRWKYPFGRMYRTMLLDVGHIAQSFVLTATALGLGAFQTAAFQDPLIEDALCLDAADEPLLHAVGAGVLPRTTGATAATERSP